MMSSPTSYEELLTSYEEFLTSYDELPPHLVTRPSHNLEATPRSSDEPPLLHTPPKNQPNVHGVRKDERLGRIKANGDDILTVLKG